MSEPVLRSFSLASKDQPSDHASLLAQARSFGCNCNPEITILPNEDLDGTPLRRAEIRHDDWCALLAVAALLSEPPDD